MLSAIISTLSVTISGITFSILKRHVWAAISFLFALVLAECLACVYIHDDSWLGMVFICWALFLYYTLLNEWKAYKSHRPNRIYEDFTKIPQGVYYFKMTNGKFKTICEEDAQIFSKQGATIMQNELQPKATNKKKETSPWELPMDERIVNAICNMMRDPRHTIGYDPQTPLGLRAGLPQVRRDGDALVHPGLSHQRRHPGREHVHVHGPGLVCDAGYAFRLLIRSPPFSDTIYPSSP